MKEKKKEKTLKIQKKSLNIIYLKMSENAKKYQQMPKLDKNVKKNIANKNEKHQKVSTTKNQKSQKMERKKNQFYFFFKSKKKLFFCLA